MIQNRNNYYNSTIKHRQQHLIPIISAATSFKSTPSHWTSKDEKKLGDHSIQVFVGLSASFQIKINSISTESIKAESKHADEVFPRCCHNSSKQNCNGGRSTSCLIFGMDGRTGSLSCELCL